MATQFTAPYQSIYEAGLARQRENEARQRGLALRRAQAQGVMTSGVSQLPQQDISREAMRAEADLGARVGQAQEAERLQDKAYDQRLGLMERQASLAEAAEARRASMLRRQQKAALGGQIIGAVTGGVTGALARKYLEE